MRNYFFLAFCLVVFFLSFGCLSQDLMIIKDEVDLSGVVKIGTLDTNRIITDSPYIDIDCLRFPDGNIFCGSDSNNSGGDSYWIPNGTDSITHTSDKVKINKLTSNKIFIDSDTNYIDLINKSNKSFFRIYDKNRPLVQIIRHTTDFSGTQYNDSVLTAVDLDTNFQNKDGGIGTSLIFLVRRTSALNNGDFNFDKTVGLYGVRGIAHYMAVNGTSAGNRLLPTMRGISSEIATFNPAYGYIREISANYAQILLNHTPASGQIYLLYGNYLKINNATTSTINEMYGNYLYGYSYSAGGYVNKLIANYVSFSQMFSKGLVNVNNAWGLYYPDGNFRHYLMGKVGIGTATPNYPLQVDSNISDISIYSGAKVSATGYITRTSVFDKARAVKEGKKALDYVQDASYYTVNVLGGEKKLDHSKFYGGVEYVKRKYRVVVPEPDCVVEAGETEETCRPVIPEYVPDGTVTEKGVDLEQEINVLRQAVFELKTELCTYKRYSWCN